MTKIDQDWWRGAVIYQIYPRSYQDSTGSGVGDLAGITQRLEYVASLGVDAVWISPFFQSPMEDYGYDVSDYRAIDPIFGSLADFDAMIEKAHDLGLRILIDLVLSHSSAQHPWFEESRQNRTNPRSDWYVWSDPQSDGTPPNNWLSIFGGSAWQWDTRREQYYLHNFLTSQPDFNFHKAEVQDALLDVARFWLDRGVDGFRLDTINFYFHDQQLRSNPALAPEERANSIAPSVNPYNHQRHLYSKNRPENLAFLGRLRALMDEYEGRTALGEVGDAQFGLEILGQYTRGNEGVHMSYAFELLEGQALTAERLAAVFARVDEVAADGWACWAYSNHDVVRHTSRWGLGDDAQRLYVLLLACLRGSMCLYQGEELGLPEADIAFEDLQDPYGIEFWPEFKGRDGCRTPMVWEAQSANAGFSAGKPWLPVSAAHLERAVDQQNGDEGSMLNHYRQTVGIRKAHRALAKGIQSPIIADGNLAHFTRELDGEQVFCAFNLGEEPISVSLPEGRWVNVAGGLAGDIAGDAEQVELAAWAAIVAKRG